MKMIRTCVDTQEETISAPLPKRGVKQVEKKNRTSKDPKFDVEIGGYEMDNIILDLGSDVNILPKKSWLYMSKPKLVWSSVQLRLVNQYKIYHIERL